MRINKMLASIHVARLLAIALIVGILFAPAAIAQRKEYRAEQVSLKIVTAAPSTDFILNGYATLYLTSTGPKYIDKAGTITAVPTTGTAALSANRFIYAGTSGVLTAAAAATNGQLLIGSTGAAPALAALTAGAGVTVTNGAGSITLKANFDAPPAIGDVTPAAITGTTVTANTSLTINGGTAITKVISATAALDFDLSGAASQDLTITCTGAALGDSVALGIPHASVTADTLFIAWVSAADTVTVRALRTSGTPDPASGAFRATVVKF